MRMEGFLRGSKHGELPVSYRVVKTCLTLHPPGANMPLGQDGNLQADASAADPLAPDYLMLGWTWKHQGWPGRIQG